jgi:hypothetical protein
MMQQLLLDLLPPSLPPSIQSATLVVLLIALLHNTPNTRVFESVDGLLAVSALLQDSETTPTVRTKVLEFLYLYLLPESSSAGTYETDTMKKVPSSVGGSSGDFNMTEVDEFHEIRTRREKERLLGRYFNDVEGLVKEVRAKRVFEGGAVG